MKRIVLLAFACLLAPLIQAETFTGRVVRVLDGDTVEVLDASNTPHRVRLAGIDAPEKAQAFGSRAKQQLAGLVGGQVVEVQSDKTDRYGRTVGKILVEGQDANIKMLNAGLAWWYRKYASEQPAADRLSYEAAENQARAERRGLWGDPAPVAPWDFRHTGQTGGAGAAAPAGSAPVQIQVQPQQVGDGRQVAGVTCGAKRTCREMADCAEARAYLEQCGLSTLDGNHDGIPCNSLCR